MPDDTVCEENTVQCLLFTSNSNLNAEYWEQLCSDLNEKIKYYSKDYIWHIEEFKIHRPVTEQLSDIPDHLSSITCFGDNIEDEWFIVFIILQLSKEFKDLVIQVNDSDGEFLLIEAADYLPSWANPSTINNRVFIHDGNLHLIFPEIVETSEHINIKKAVELVIDPEVDTIVSNEIKQVIQKRISNYPDNIQQLFHNSLVLLPIDIATLIKIKPCLISPLVNTYCSLDIIDVKTCTNMQYKECILTDIKFTKCLYAMLNHSKMIENFKMSAKTPKEVILGMKLTFAFYLIMNKMSEDIFSSKRFTNFVKNLTKNGYFRENLEGSKGYKELFEKAKEYYLNNEYPINSRVKSEIQNLMSSDEFTEARTALKDKPLAAQNKGDDDSWLNITPEELDDLLISRYGKQIKFKKDEYFTAESITTELSSFLKQSSDFEGVETLQEAEDDAIDFNPNEFEHSVDKLLNVISSKTHDININSSEESESDLSTQDDYFLDREIKSKLQDNFESTKDSSCILQNMLQSMKEEHVSGPSSNIFRTLGISKSVLLDSDDDDDEPGNK